MTIHRAKLYTAVSAFALLMLTGCNNMQPIEVAAQGANPPLGVNVGPIPGPPQPAVAQRVNPYAQDKIAVTEGRRLFLWYNCYGCHGGRAGGGMGPSLRDPVWLFGDSDAQIFNSIAQGRSEGMPAWGTRIPEDQIWKLVAYIKTLNTPAEPDPPTR